MIKENNCGVIVTLDNAEAFADGMVYLAKPLRRSVRNSEKYHELAEREFDRNKLGARIRRVP